MMGGDPMTNRSDEQLRVLLEASPIPLIISRVSDGKILYANKHLGELVGLMPDELIGRETPDGASAFSCWISSICLRDCVFNSCR